jgi:hypothetical protein
LGGVYARLWQMQRREKKTEDTKKATQTVV